MREIEVDCGEEDSLLTGDYSVVCLDHLLPERNQSDCF